MATKEAKPQDEQSHVSMSVRVPVDLHTALKHHADECGTTLSTYVNWTLEKFHAYLHARFMKAAQDVPFVPEEDS